MNTEILVIDHDFVIERKEVLLLALQRRAYELIEKLTLSGDNISLQISDQFFSSRNPSLVAGIVSAVTLLDYAGELNYLSRILMDDRYLVANMEPDYSYSFVYSLESQRITWGTIDSCRLKDFLVGKNTCYASVKY
jgi:hypothetical protein